LDRVDFEWLNVFADYTAISLANTRAFAESEQARNRLEEENECLRREISAGDGADSLIGRSVAMQSVMQYVKLVARTDATVLISGESGTGKELIAHAIHEQSPRRHRPLIKVNCAAITETLFESEFFGHVRGAFTGAIKDHAGRFELANGGTLFLDEIGEVPLAMQSKLLRVLEHREFERVGEAHSQKVDVRIIAATNRDLQVEVEGGRFRSDLLYRVSIFPLPLPPLRERGEDVLHLARHFAEKSAHRFKYPVPELDEAAENQVLAYPWPGNVRELQNVIERAVILSEGKSPYLALPVLRQTDKDLSKTALPAPLDRVGLLTGEELKQQERANLLAALKRSGGKVFGLSGAAALLGVKPTTLATRIKKLGLKRDWPCALREP
jgi:transcriptional regulator with GAF, ATPase, and Fis domain